MKRGITVIFALCLFALLNLYSSCRDNRINHTIDKALKTIEEQDYKEMHRLIGTQITTDTSMEDIVSKMVELRYFIGKYHLADIKTLPRTTDGMADGMGKFTYVIPIYNGYDSSTVQCEISDQCRTFQSFSAR